METLIDYLKTNKPKGFTPRPFYSVEGDSLTFHIKDSESYGERMDDFLTVYKAIGTDELVGCQVKGLLQTLELLGNFGLILEGKEVKLGMIFMACMASTPESTSKERYLELGRAAGTATINAKELEPIMA